MQRLLTGIQPSGVLHIGNYFGALKPFLEIYEGYESMLMIADYHALTTLREPKQLRQNIVGIVKDYIGVGIDPKKAIIFRQSDIQEHTELAWILECLVTVAFLSQAHAYKDKVAKGLEANAGLFNYPMLMAADILLYDTEVVPTGEDQRQHIEYTREAAAKFNGLFGDTFKGPQERILKGAGMVPGVDGRKMSKSYGNIIPLFGTPEEIKKATMSIVTDSKGDSPEIVYSIHTFFRDRKELSELYKNNKGNYKSLKEALATDIESVIAPLRTRRESVSDDEVKRILAEGAEKARGIAIAKMKFVREKIGIAL
ncbi:MAG TPA: tryptophan--tRNA ligase [Candidatus Paceibacterota bacterium]